MTEEIVVNNGKRLLTLDELAQTQPGMDRLMAEIGDRAWRLYHAGHAGNWPLAGYFCRTLGKHLRMSAFVRPKYADAMDEFLETDFAPVRDAISAGDGPAFEEAWRHLVERINHWHEHFGKGYIVWRTPDAPPPDLDLTPRSQA
jgi:hypothetical protein